MDLKIRVSSWQHLPKIWCTVLSEHEWIHIIKNTYPNFYLVRVQLKRIVKFNFQNYSKFIHENIFCNINNNKLQNMAVDLITRFIIIIITVI